MGLLLWDRISFISLGGENSSAYADRNDSVEGTFEDVTRGQTFAS